MEHLDPDLLSAYIDGELSAEELSQVERHLGSCATCRAEHDELRGIATLVRELPVYLPRRQIDLDTAGPSRSGTLARIVEFSKPLAVAAVILLVAFAGLRLLTDLANDDDPEGDQISFRAVQPTSVADGTEPIDGASDTTVAEAPAAGPQSGEAESDAAMPAAMEQEAMEADAPDDSTPAVMQMEPAEQAVAPTATAEVAAGDEDDDTGTRVAAGIVAAVVILVGGAAAWYMFFRPPRRARD